MAGLVRATQVALIRGETRALALSLPTNLLFGRIRTQ